MLSNGKKFTENLFTVLHINFSLSLSLYLNTSHLRHLGYSVEEDIHFTFPIMYINKFTLKYYRRSHMYLFLKRESQGKEFDQISAKSLGKANSS